jgi:hypothetical protein
MTNFSNVTSRQDKLETSHSSINTKLDFLINAFQNNYITTKKVPNAQRLTKNDPIKA